ncbi:5-oxoprolinase subunit PxpA [Flavisolibacter ginsenosidimutans]|uniref:LamB/YcsF family protein n=1 Tax=Flavisolibacter ginsenosidimutans TaxID=661481 RepID=A0A5B8UKG8_9BACT|nr:5-oxoprolinase subunit PxpA [Flavisolibacter ginsenosidimutans]QEC57048.1 LamB/YcsF family protein [Flavisolibacter ginsenosidimutans]
MHIDINCDTGEGIGNDEALMPLITSANIACGYHAGNEGTLRTTMLLTKKYGVHAGAHPSFPDRENFGRTEMAVTPQELYHFVSKQLHLFDKIAAECSVSFHHVKPHGALYNMAARNMELAEAFAFAVRDFKSHLIVYGLSNSFLVSKAKKLGLPAKHEVFADRTYQDDGSLTPRSQANALIEDEDKAVQQVLQMIEKKTVTTNSGKEISIHADTVCLHGDGQHAVSFAQKIFHALQQRNLVDKAI